MWLYQQIGLPVVFAD